MAISYVGWCREEIFDDLLEAIFYVDPCDSHSQSSLSANLFIEIS